MFAIEDEKWPEQSLLVAGLKLVLRKDGHPLEHATRRNLGADNVGEDEVLLEPVHGVLLLLPGQRLVQTVRTESFVIPATRRDINMVGG